MINNFEIKNIQILCEIQLEIQATKHNLFY